MKTFPNSEINLKTLQIFVDHKKVGKFKNGFL